MSAVSGLCVEDEQSLLLQLKNNEFKFHASWSTKLVSWNQSIPHCDWNGVTCNKEGHVTGLDLSSEAIDAELHNSSALFCLQHLQNLDLSYNIFYSSISPAIKNLKNLVSLNLSHNDLEGQIPMEISQLKNLVCLNLSSSSSLNLENPNLQQLVQNLTKIRYLYLDYIDISAQGKDWSNALLAIPSLEEVSMRSCNLSGPIDSSLGRLEHLSRLYLDNNHLLSPVPESFANLKKLTVLNLANCNLIGDFPQKIFEIATLSYLSLSYNFDLHGSFKSFPLNGSLQTLKVTGTNFTGPIPFSLFELPFIEHIDLSSNHFDGELKPNMLQVCRHLQTLDLSSNHLNGDLNLNMFQGCHRLQTLDLSSNHLNGDLNLNMLQGCQYLQRLDLSYNNLSADANIMDANLSSFPNLEILRLSSCNLREFPMFLRNQSQIFNLDLSNNQIEGVIPHWIWKILQVSGHLNLSLNSLTSFETHMLNYTINLDAIDIHSNKLNGKIPPFITSFFLDLSSNNFNTVIPHNIGAQFHSVHFLKLSRNKFHGDIPHSLCNIPRMYLLDLSNNVLEGTIPPCLIHSETLQILILGKNKLKGNIPNAFPKACDFFILDVQENQLSGFIPKSMISCTNLGVLNLGNNYISGYFPCFLRNLSLEVLVLRKNQFQGPIGCLENDESWPFLQIIDLAFNKFTGFLPAKAFTASELMMLNIELQHTLFSSEPYIVSSYSAGTSQYYSMTIVSKGREMVWDKILYSFTCIDFSSNNFEGPIPKELMNLVDLHVLNLSNNAFSGKIPSSIGNMKQLESLDLSNNSLTAEIPTELASLSFLSFLNLSFNHLVGTIPRGTQIQSFDASSFQGNKGLYGPPLTKIPNNGRPGLMLPPLASRNDHGIDFKFITGMEFGVIFGLAIIIGPLFFWSKWKIRYWKYVDDVLCIIFPQLYLDYQRHEGQWHPVLRWSR
ncbi:receptor-like protein 33 [Prosopis cineraria]|uniref:receptor-like protein 33 n=1 Tax=Prosopis cineraria TaxID=364024 RepID=UPI002410733E|nr:receptor-like protein 33 [Prosopis cineraria]